MISIHDLHREIEQREQQKTKIYETVYEKCIQRIQTTNAKSTDCCCFFECPKLVFGVPLFDVSACVSYIMNELMKKGFEVYYTHPNLLYISWKRKATPYRALLPPSPIETRPSQKSIYHITDLEELRDKGDLLLENTLSEPSTRNKQGYNSSRDSKKRQTYFYL